MPKKRGPQRYDSIDPFTLALSPLSQRGYNRKLYLDFQEELCVHSIHKVLREGESNTTLSSSIYNQCMLPRIADSMTKVLSSLCTYSDHLTELYTFR